MNNRHRSGRFRRAVIASATALAFSAGAVLAEQVMVQGRNAEIVEGMASDAPTVELVAPGNKLEVIAKTGRWLNVRTPSGKTGYIPIAMVKRDTSGFDLSKITGGSSAGEASAANAGRGLTEEAAAYARSRGYRTDAPDRLVLQRQKYKPELRQFKEEGSVGVQR